MNLSSLSLNDLHHVQNVLSTLQASGAVAVEYGLEPFFNLTPGLPVTMTLGTLFGAEPAFATATADVPPPAPRVGLASQAEDFGPRLGWDELDREIHLLGYTGGAHSLGVWGELTLSASLGGRVTELRTYRAVEPWRELGNTLAHALTDGVVRIRDPETGWTADLPIEPLPEVAPATEQDLSIENEQALPELGEGALSAAPEDGNEGEGIVSAAPLAATEAPDAGDPPPSLSASGVSVDPVVSFHLAPWTDAEDAALIGTVVAFVRQGRTKADAMRAVAEKTGRTFDAIKARLRDKLGDHLGAALTPTTEAPPVEAVGQGVAAVEPVTPAPVAADDLTTHILGLPRKGGWTMDRDLTLARLTVESGWPIQEVALDLNVDTRAIKARWDLLTGQYQDDKTGKWLRRFFSKELLATLQRLAGE